MIGVLSQELRQLWHVRCQAIDAEWQQQEVASEAVMGQVKDLIGKIFGGEGVDDGEEDGDHDPLTCPNCTAAWQLRLLSDKREALDTLFWGSVRMTLVEEAAAKVRTGGGIGIRKEWQIVALDGNRSQIASLGGIVGVMMSSARSH